MRSALFWDITQPRVVILMKFLDFLILQDGTDRLSRNVGIESPLYAA
jgi:hypothetical protein